MTPKQEKAFLQALEEMVTEKGISKETVVEAISEAFRVTYNKKLSDELLVVHKIVKKKPVVKKVDEEGNEIKPEQPKLADALITCDINLEKGRIKTYRQWKIVEEDDLTDDFVEISIEDERIKGAKKYKVGGYYEEPLSFDLFSKGDVNRFVSAYKQKISRAEKESLLIAFEDKIGELITGVVEKSDEFSCIVNLGRASVTLFQRDLIGREVFKPGDSIKVYVMGINKDEAKGTSSIHCSRSCPEFLAKLFAHEIHEIYDGTVIIKKVARLSGNRSKVAVYSEDPNVDPSGACIGPNGARIQTIVSQLGNDRNNKEKVDVIEYNDNLGMFLRECLKPGIMVGAKFEDTPKGKVAYVICEDNTGSAAIGFKGTNVILARQLTGLADIKVLDVSVAIESGLTTWTTMEEFEAEAREQAKEKFRETSIKNADLVSQMQSKITEVGPTVNDEEKMDEDIQESLEEEINAEETKVTPVEEEVRPEVKVETPEVEEVKVEEKPIEHKEVKTTTTLGALEAALENEKKQTPKQEFKKKKVQKEIKETIKPIIDNSQKMDIYSQEELEAMENEELDEEFEDEEDYSEYDSDSYYDDK